jgi:hypothetical protein
MHVITGIKLPALFTQYIGWRDMTALRPAISLYTLKIKHAIQYGYIPFLENPKR